MIMMHTSIRPGKQIGDPKVHDLRAIQYTDNGKVYFKLSFSDKEWSLIPQRQQITAVEVEWEKMFSRLIPIKKRKFDDLQPMKHVMPRSVTTSSTTCLTCRIVIDYICLLF